MGLKPRKLSERFWEKVKKSNGCWLWMACRDRRGYGRFGMGRKHQPAVMDAHRVSYMLTHGGRLPTGKEICHRCDNPPCVRPSHLYADTHKQNQRDMSVHGRAATGKRHGLVLHPERI